MKRERIQQILEGELEFSSRSGKQVNIDSLVDKLIATESSREAQMVVLSRDENGKPKVWCDPDVADLVQALNNGGVPTVASCSGHGERNGNIALKDGRELIIAKDFEDARRIEGLL